MRPPWKGGTSRIMLEDLRIGVGEGNLREAIARAFAVDAALVEHANQAMNDLGEVARLARADPEALKQVRIQPFRPVRMMLAQQGTIGTALAEGGPLAAEFKYDGSRFQFHRVGNTARLYSRRLEDVTDALPDILEKMTGSTTRDVIVDGEAVATRDGRPLPFQEILRRFRRKHDVGEMSREIQLEPYSLISCSLTGRP